MTRPFSQVLDSSYITEIGSRVLITIINWAKSIAAFQVPHPIRFFLICLVLIGSQWEVMHVKRIMWFEI